MTPKTGNLPLRTWKHIFVFLDPSGIVCSAPVVMSHTSPSPSPPPPTHPTHPRHPGFLPDIIYSQVLVPLDYSPSFDRSKLIVDDEIFARLILPLPKGVTLNFVIDTCHSGSLTDLQWMWDGERFRKEGPRESRGGLAVCLSGCCDDEESTDVSSFDGTSAGVLTSCWLRAIEEGHLTCVDATILSMSTLLFLYYYYFLVTVFAHNSDIAFGATCHIFLLS